MAESGSGSLERIAALFTAKLDTSPLASLRAKSLAVASGKGGVGKSITSANLGIFYARRGLRTALIDLDPLSDLASLLDFQEAERVLAGGDALSATSDRSEVTLPLFPNLDLLLPLPTAGGDGAQTLLVLLFGRLAAELDASYDLLIYDMPAGADYEDNLVFLPFTGTLVVVTNPDPPSHAAAGGYIKRVLERYPGTRVRIWHNRYARDPSGEFDAADVVENYNRMAPEEQRLTAEERSLLTHAAFIPEDAALNLLLGDSSLAAGGYRAIKDSLAFIQSERLNAIAQNLMISPRLLDYVVHFVIHHPEIEQIDRYLEELGQYIGRLAVQKSRTGADTRLPESAPGGVGVFTDEERHTFHAYLQIVRKDPVRAAASRTLTLVERHIEELENSARAFFVQPPVAPDKGLDREIATLLVQLKKSVQVNSTMRNSSGLLLFYFALTKLLQSETVVSLIKGFVPSRKDRSGRLIRDRNRQIRNLVSRDGEYQRRFLRLVKTLYPVVQKQIASLVKTLGLQNLLFREASGKVARSAYLKLFSSFVHDMVHSGLSVVVGFSYRSTSQAFSEAAERLLEEMGQGGKGKEGT